MIGEVLKGLVQGILRRARVAAPPGSFPAEELRALKALHERSPVDLHKRILYGGRSIEGAGLLQLYEECLNATGTSVSPWKIFVRVQAAENLARYFVHSLQLDGARAECGVFQGFSALLACRAAALKQPGFSAADFHLIDSFEGFPQPRPEDFMPVRLADGSAGSAPAFGAGDASASFEQVRRALRDFPGVRFHRGFIPQVLAETRWAYAHIDVDLHEPTLESLAYFYPRMVPGARKAWDGYCRERDIPFVVLETGQAVIVK